MTDAPSKPFETWAIVELMGHRRVIGKISEKTIGAATFLQVDILKPDGQGFISSQLYNPSAIYCITPTDEVSAKAMRSENREATPHLLSLPENTGRILRAGREEL